MAEALGEPWIGLDIEGNGFYRYPEQVCLIQISIGDTPYLVDPLDIKDLGPLGKVLSEPSITKIVHSGDYDIRSLHRDYGLVFDGVFDTSIAAAFLGSKRLGLDAILKEYIDADVSKDKRLQRSDWTLRPLTREAIVYAADDVRYLGEARSVLTEQLVEKGRIDWVEEECRRLQSVRFEPRDEQTAFLNVKGSRDLGGTALAILRRLYDLREDEAIGRDRPPFKVVSDSVLVDISRDPDQDYSVIKGIGHWARSDARKRIGTVVEEARSDEPVQRPRNQTRRGPHLSNKEREQANQNLRDLKQWRKSQGESLELDPSLLWPTVSLGRISRQSGNMEDEFSEPEVRDWQIKEFGEGLERFISSLGD